MALIYWNLMFWILAGGGPGAEPRPRRAARRSAAHHSASGRGGRRVPGGAYGRRPSENAAAQHDAAQRAAPQQHAPALLGGVLGASPVGALQPGPFPGGRRRNFRSSRLCCVRRNLARHSQPHIHQRRLLGKERCLEVSFPCVCGWGVLQGGGHDAVLEPPVCG